MPFRGTYAYDYDTAVHQDHVLVPYYNIGVSTQFLTEGITYDDLSDADKERHEEDFTEADGNMPVFVPLEKLNKWGFNQPTVVLALQDLMTKGMKVAGGDRIAKMDHDAAMAAFSAFINEQSLNVQQIAFVQKVISHVEQNGYMEDVAELLKPPFDKPTSFIRLFDAVKQRKLMEAIKQVKADAAVQMA